MCGIIGILLANENNFVSRDCSSLGALDFWCLWLFSHNIALNRSINYCLMDLLSFNTEVKTRLASSQQSAAVSTCGRIMVSSKTFFNSIICLNCVVTWGLVMCDTRQQDPAVVQKLNLSIRTTPMEFALLTMEIWPILWNWQRLSVINLYVQICSYAAQSCALWMNPWTAADDCLYNVF